MCLHSHTIRSELVAGSACGRARSLRPPFAPRRPARAQQLRTTYEERTVLPCGLYSADTSPSAKGPTSDIRTPSFQAGCDAHRDELAGVSKSLEDADGKYKQVSQELNVITGGPFLPGDLPSLARVVFLPIHNRLFSFRVLPQGEFFCSHLPSGEVRLFGY